MVDAQRAGHERPASPASLPARARARSARDRRRRPRRPSSPGCPSPRAPARSPTATSGHPERAARGWSGPRPGPSPASPPSPGSSPTSPAGCSCSPSSPTGTRRRPRPRPPWTRSPRPARLRLPLQPAAYRGGVTMASLIDWDVAARAGRGGSAGVARPSRPRGRRRRRRLYRGPPTRADHVGELTHLPDRPSPPPPVVDRPGWIDTNAAGMSTLMTPIVDRLVEQNPVGMIAERIGGRLTGAQMGGLLAFLAAKVLGQYEFAEPVQRAADARRAQHHRHRGPRRRPRDFGLWVCVHEATHRLQFTAVPWLRDHFRDEVTTFASGMESDRVTAALRPAAGDLVKAPRPGDGRVAARAAPRPRAERDARPPPRVDVPARGARRARHGRGRARGRPRARSSRRRFTAGAAAAEPIDRLLRVPARRPGQDPAVRAGPRVRRPSSRRSGWRGSTPSGPRPRRCRPRRRSPTRRPG